MILWPVKPNDCLPLGWLRFNFLLTCVMRHFCTRSVPYFSGYELEAEWSWLRGFGWWLAGIDWRVCTTGNSTPARTFWPLLLLCRVGKVWQKLAPWSLCGHFDQYWQIGGQLQSFAWSVHSGWRGLTGQRPCLGLISRPRNLNWLFTWLGQCSDPCWIGLGWIGLGGGCMRRPRSLVHGLAGIDWRFLAGRTCFSSTHWPPHHTDFTGHHTGPALINVMPGSLLLIKFLNQIIFIANSFHHYADERNSSASMKTHSMII